MSDFDKDYGTLYDSDTLTYWHGRYGPNIEWNVHDLLMQRLTPEELAPLEGLRLELPLIDPQARYQTPLSFYAISSPPQIVVPILSVKFLDDLSIASAWLEENGFSQETILDYAALLKYSNGDRFAGGRFPDPLTALQIPDNALDDPRVDDLSQKILKSSLVWVLAHELGHVCYGHQGYSGITMESAQQHEADADAFATEMFRRIGTYPGGMALLFLVFSRLSPNRGDFATEEAWRDYMTHQTTHPISRARLRAIAEDLRSDPHGFAGAEPDQAAAAQAVLYIAGEIENIVEKLDDPDLQRLLRARAAATDLEALAPRRIGETVVSGMRGGRGEQPFEGVYGGPHTRNLAAGGTETLDSVLVLERGGDNVSGRFGFGVGEGALHGQVIDGVLYFDWEWGDSHGKGRFEATTAAAFDGEWGYDDERDGGGVWSGLRADSDTGA